MKKMMKRLAAVSMSALMLMGAMTACGTTENNTPSGEDVVQTTAGISSDTVIGTVNGVEIDAGLYTYWLAYCIDYYGSDWETEVDDDGTTLDEYLKELALQTAQSYALVESKAVEYDITLTEEQQSEVDSIRQLNIDQFGEDAWDAAVEDGTIEEAEFDDGAKASWIAEQGEALYEQRMTALSVSESVLTHLSTVSYLYQNLIETLFAEGGAEYPTDEEFQTFVDEYGFYSTRYILFSGYDDEGNSLDETAMAELKAEVEQVRQEILNAEDQEAAFVSMMALHNDDSTETEEGITAYDGQLVSEYQEAALAMDEYEISEVVESTYGYFIIEKLPLDTETVMSNYTSVAESVLLDEWVEDAEMETTEAYDSFDVAAYFDALTVLRQQVDPDTYGTSEEEEAE